ncbi:MAG: glucoamylase family protein [Candidatus Omnitrophota bacterium]|jgi:cyclic beta-1,2-glucan synthetase
MKRSLEEDKKSPESLIKESNGSFPENPPLNSSQKKSSFFRLFPAVLFAALLAAGIYAWCQLAETRLAAILALEEKSYFTQLYRDTWNYLSQQIDGQTKLPYDSSAQQPVTSISNVGFYIASAAVAHKTGLIGREEALSRIRPCLEALGKIEKWRGFPRPWFLVRSLKPSFGDEFSYDSHLSVLIGGLVVTQNIFPEVSGEISRLFGTMKFRDLYDKQSGWLKGDYNTRNQNFAVMQPWGHWYYKYFASEGRLLSFYGVARRGIPWRHWFSLVRRMEKRDGEKVFISGFDSAGLEVQFLAGLFLDERRTSMGKSQKNLVRYQMKHARKIKAPVWGWAAAQSPNQRYLVHGDLQDEVVAPYASILAAIYFPHEAYQNLQKLESLGLRPSGNLETKEQFGFLDSVNWKTGDISPDFMTTSHGMSFLALANLLYDGIVWKTFEKDPVVQRGLKIR